MRRALVAGAAAAGLAALFAANGPAAARESWRVARADVRVVCPLTVGGSFEARTSSLAGSLAVAAVRPAALTGGLAVDLRTLDTGIGLRNDHLRGTYLEVDKGEGYDTAVLSDIRLADAGAEGFPRRTSFTGLFLLHGVKKTIAGQAEVRREGSSVRVEASFPVTLADYGIARPQYMGLGVKGQVQVKVSLVLSAVAPSAVQ